MYRLLSFTLLVLLTGCASHEPWPNPPDPPTEPYLVEMRDRVKLTDTWTAVTPDGQFFSERTETEWVIHQHEGVPVRWKQRMHYFHSTTLSADQIAEIHRLLVGFKDLSDDPYDGPDDGPNIQLGHDGKLVSGGADAPAAVWAIRDYLWTLTRNAPVVYSYTPDVDLNQSAQPSPVLPPPPPPKKGKK